MKRGQFNKLVGTAPLVPNRHQLPVAAISCLFLLLLVTACSREEQATPTITMTPTPNVTSTSSPTATRTPRPSFTPWPTRQYVRPSHITPSPTRRFNRPTPTLTATAIPLAIFNMIAGDANPANYQLTTPEPELIIQVIAEADEQKLDSRWGAAEDEPYQEARYTAAGAVYQAAIFEIQHHYPQGLPDPRLAFSIRGSHFTWDEDDFSLFMPLLQAGIFGLLRDIVMIDHLSINRENMEIQVFKAELDGDPGDEWLVFANASQYGVLTWLRMDTLADGSRQLMPFNADTYNFHIYASDPVLVEWVGDFNQDGFTDMLLNAPWYFGGTYNQHFVFAQGSTTGFKVISDIEVGAFETDGYVEYTVSQPPNTDQLILTISDPVDLNWGCRYDTMTTYEWHSGDLRTTQEGAEPPLTAECYLARAVTPRAPLDPYLNIAALQQALALFAEDDPEDIPKIAFAHYRMAVLYAMLDEDAQARAHLQAFLDFNRLAGSGLVYTVESEVTGLMSAPQLDPLALCGWIASTTYTHFPDWELYVNENSVYHVYPMYNEIAPPALCPVSQVVDWILDSVTVDPGISPQNALVSAGLPVVTAQSLWLPGWPEPAWLVLLQFDTYRLVSYRPWNADDPWKEERSFSSNSGDATWRNQDITGDGYPEIAFAVPVLDMGEQGTIGYQVSITSMVAEGIMLTVGSYDHPANGEQFNLVRFLADNDHDGLADVAVTEAALWYEALPPLDPADPPVWLTYNEWSGMLRDATQAQQAQEVEPEVLAALFEGADPAETRLALSHMRDGIQDSDPATLLFWQRLTYLVGLSYELEGRAEQAVAAYLEVILADPNSLWSSLAAIHLAPVEQP
jgi:hypothetical protein